MMMKTTTRQHSAKPIKSGALLCYARDRLLSFACLLWPDYEPAAHHRMIAKKLERVERGKLSRLMIFMPPRHGKSLLCSEFFVAWYIGKNPEKQVIFATYSQDLADDFGRRVRNWIRDPAFQAIFPGVTLAEDSQAASRFNVGARGSYFAVGVGGSITGRGADLLVIDDPLKGREEADSETVRRKLKAWYTSVAYTRLMPGAAIVLIQTRWHPEDLGGWLLKEHQHERWKPLSLSALSEAGTALWPKRYPVAALERIRETLPKRDWSALYQQSPIIDGGNILKKKWWRKWTKSAPVCSYILQSWDTAYSEADLKTNSYSARTTWGVFKPTEDEIALILIEAWHGRVDYPDLKKEAIRSYLDQKPDCVLIEKKASGQSLIQDLRRAGVPVATYQPDRDKVARAYAVQAMLECGQIYYPARRWADDVIDECAQFPSGSYSDWVDTCTQAWLRIRNSGMLGKIIREPKSPDELEALFPNQGKSEPMRGGVYG